MKGAFTAAAPISVDTLNYFASLDIPVYEVRMRMRIRRERAAVTPTHCTALHCTPSVTAPYQ